MTLLVISFDEIPSSYAEMIASIKRIPAFAASFAVLMMFWLRHRRWSRRYGLENHRTIFLSLALILVVLVYVYPLRTIFESMFSFLSGGYLSSTFQVQSLDEVRGIFVYYSVGFFALSILFHQLYTATLSSAALLALNPIEIRKTRINLYAWTISASFGLSSIILALILPDAWVPIAGYMYFALFAFLALPSFLDRRMHPQDE